MNSTGSKAASRKHSQHLRNLGRLVERIATIFGKKKLRGNRAKARFLGKSGLFDRDWYLAQYPDVASVGIDPILHYLKYGAAEGRDPGPRFDTLWYLETNPDVMGAGINPLYHYAKQGRKEGRTPTPQASPVDGLGEFDDLQPAYDLAAQALAAPDQRTAVLNLLRACDPAVARALELNLDAWAAIAERRRATDRPIAVVVCHNEISGAHGTGVLIKRLFGEVDSLVTIRTWSSFDNRDDIGMANIWLGKAGLSDQQIYRLLSFLLAGQRASYVAAVPYNDMDLRVALRAAEILSAPLVPYIMDDNNIIGRRINDRTMGQAVRTAAVRFVISTEMRQAYEAKFREKFFVLPPLVPPEFLDASARPADQIDRGIIIGNIWVQKWLDELLKVLEQSKLSVDWVCNTKNPRWLRFDREKLAARGLHVIDPMPERQLVEQVRKRPFCILPTTSGDGDASDASARAIARLSLPSRVALVVAACNVPVIVVGDEETAAARFVRRFGVGVAVPYDPKALKQAVDQVRHRVAGGAMRTSAAKLGRVFSSEGIEDWFLGSVRAGQAADDRFESLFATAPGEIALHVDRPCPPEIGLQMADVFRALRRLKKRGFSPDFVVDAGASNGVWAQAVATLFPRARFLLVEPLLRQYKAKSGIRAIEQRPQFELEEVALLDREGEVEIQVSGDIYNSSTMGVRLTGVNDVIKVPVTTLDALAKKRRLEGRGLLKIDVQYAEHLVLDGGRDLLQNHIDAVILELTLRREHPDALTFLEICNKMAGLGFSYEDDTGEWRSPIDGRLEQKDVLFLREDAAFA